jgi:hypothetical protein
MIQYNPAVKDNRADYVMQAAQTNADAMKGLGEDIGGAIASLAGSYVQGKQLKAKADGYNEFLGMHGEQLGFQPEWLAEFKKKSPMQQIALGDMLINSYIPHAQRMDYANTIMARRATPVGTGTAATAGAGGGGGGDVFTF